MASISTSPRPARDRLALVAVMAGTTIIYLRSLRNGFVYDDIDLVLNNRYIGQWSFLWRAFTGDEYWFVDPFHIPQTNRYRPLLLDWVGVHYRLFGVNPLGWHATMVALHLIVVALVYKVATRVTDRSGAAVLAAAIFALMPMHAEAIVWVAAVGLPLAAAFQLAAFALFIDGETGGKRSIGRLAISVACYACALLCHETAATFPALIACYVLVFADRRENPVDRIRDAILRAAPFAVIAAVYLIVRRLVLGFATLPGAVNHASFAQRLMTLPWIIATYLELTVIPWLPGPAHRVLFVSSPLALEFYLPAAALVAIGAALVLALGSHPDRRLLLFCALWSAITISPVMYLPALLPNQLVHDNYAYLPSVGLCIALADWAAGIANASALGRRAVAIGAPAMLALFAACLWRVQPVWHDDLALFSRCIAVFPESAACHGELGTRLEAAADYRGAERELSRAVALEPQDGMFLYDLGVVHARMGDAARGASEAAAGLDRLPEPSAAAYVGLANLYLSAGDRARSDEEMKHAESLPGGEVELAFISARQMIAEGDAHDAIALMQALADRYPDDYRIWSALGSALGAASRFDEALAAYDRALAIAPADAGPHFMTARLLHAMGRDREAMAQCRQALEFSPADAGTLSLMEAISGAARNHPS
jgi:Flp pilus assembly protein TadD